MLSNGFVCIMGMGTVFIGLVCIVLICKLTSMVVRNVSPKSSVSAKSVSAPAAATNLPPAEKSAIIAGVCAAIAENLGTDANNIKVLSFKRK